MKITNYVNAEKRTCVVVISDMENDLRRAAKKALKNSDDISFYGDRSYLEDSIVGIAKCAPEDEFVVATGLAIAHERAMKAYVSLYNRELSQLINRISRDLGNLKIRDVYNPSIHFPV